METASPGLRRRAGPTFARLHYANTSGHVVVVPVKSTSGLSTALALPPTVGSETGTIGLILPHGTADLSFEPTTDSDPEAGCLCLVMSVARSNRDTDLKPAAVLQGVSRH